MSSESITQISENKIRVQRAEYAVSEADKVEGSPAFPGDLAAWRGVV